MNYTTRSGSLQRIPVETGKWISFQLKLHGYTHADVAQKAGVTREATSMVLNGKRSSIRVYSAIIDLLDYPSFTQLLIVARRSAA